MRGKRIAVLSIVAAGVLGALPASAGAVSVLLGPATLTGSGISVGIDCNNIAQSCAWIAGTNTSLGLEGGSVVAPADGTLTGWRVRGETSANGKLWLTVIRPLAGEKYLGIGTTTPADDLDGKTTNSGDELKMQVGDRLSISAANPPYTEDSGTATLFQRAVPGATWGSLSLLQAGSTGTLSPNADNNVLLFNATLEMERPAVAKIAPTEGPGSGGTQVTITGDHLAVVTGVSFGGVPATSFKGDNKTVTAVAPPHAHGSVEVKVTTAGGESVAVPFVYRPVDDGKGPTLKKLKLSPNSFKPANIGGSIVPLLRVGGTVGYRLSEESQVRFTVQRAVPGRKAGKKCVKPSAANAGKPRCKRFVARKGSFVDAGETGANSFVFSGRIGGKALAPGAYRLVAIATDIFGDKSKPSTASFTIAK